MRAVQQQVFNLNSSGEKSLAYVLRPTRYSTINAKQIVEYCAENSMVPKAYIQASMLALSQCISNFLLNGHNVVFPDLGTFSLTSTGFATKDVMKAGLDQLCKLNVRFQPCIDLKAKVEGVDVELDGVYEIAGETVITEATPTSPARTQKFYKKVIRTLIVDAEGNTSPDPSQGGGNSQNPSGDNTNTQKRTLTLSADPGIGGTVVGAGEYNDGATANISATANSGYKFLRWSDGNTSASRSVTMSEDKVLTAQFQVDSEGSDNSGW